MAKNAVVLVVVLSLTLSFAFGKSLPDCDEFIDEAPLSVDEIHDNCRKECPDDKEGQCFKTCVVKKVEEEGEDGEYFKFIISNVSAKKTETWKQELADLLKTKCLPILTEQKKISEAFDCYMEQNQGKCVTIV